ncbi:hypothetical protein C8R44DRAFT_947005 [Mycena epipterygia]|nr:hypothetical protein C8R44DRAFT_947005 [Mycena epipterygia]
MVLTRRAYRAISRWLPNEVVTEIIQAAPQKDRTAICRTSKLFYGLSVPVLYRVVDIDTHTSLSSFSAAISSNPNLAKAVRSFTFINNFRLSWLSPRHPGRLNLAALEIAVTLNVVTLAGKPVLDYDWFCVLRGDFVPGAFLQPINMLHRGNILVCRPTVMLESECPGIQECINKVYDSVLSAAEAYASDGENDASEDYAEVNPAFAPVGPSSSPGSVRLGPPPSSQPSSSQAGPATAGPGPSSQANQALSLHRVHRFAAEGGTPFQGLFDEDTFWEREEAEKKAMLVFKRAPIIDYEVVEVEDSDD